MTSIKLTLLLLFTLTRLFLAVALAFIGAYVTAGGINALDRDVVATVLFVCSCLVAYEGFANLIRRPM
jgi:hypothetical protein